MEEVFEIDRRLYRSVRNNANKLIEKTKSDHYISLINDNKKSRKPLFSTLNNLLGKPQDVVHPRGPDLEVANNFSNYFIDKISKIRSELSPTESNEPQDEPFYGNKFHLFRNLTELELKKIILSSKPSSCVLDKIPTRFMILILNYLLPLLTAIINSSLGCGVVPECLKHAVIKPLLKKPSINPEVLKNYRPVSNLPFLSKILEKVVKIQLLKHLETNKLIYKYQSAYRSSHSTKTDLNHVLNTNRSGVDDGNVAMLVLLDLSAAFDALDHKKILDRLELVYGLSSTVLGWFSSYLIVLVRKSFSKSASLYCCVPQGSVHGPILFCTFTKPLGNLLRRHDKPHITFTQMIPRSSTFLNQTMSVKPNLLLPHGSLYQTCEILDGHQHVKTKFGQD
ncbi:hypothetical protein SNE40_010504 [Patella caerulea]|uniref:Reverse transcriptase domain-containing protein n=1 Tax=Patella caerulea TaxID=87958 RepID=A0AAN8JTK4_PATCE